MISELKSIIYWKPGTKEGQEYSYSVYDIDDTKKIIRFNQCAKFSPAG